MENEVIVSPERPLTKNDLLAQVQLIQEVMRTVMHDGEHYGVIPGCGVKPSLLKAGAEKLLMTFRFAPEFDVIPMFPGDEEKVGYRVICRIVNRDGRFMGSGVGEASSEEKKWKWRKAVCEAEWEEADPSARRKKWESGGNYELQVANNPFDMSNTILKMAKKRAQVDATITATACSDIFTQDLEEMGADIQGGGKRQAPQKSQTPAPKAESLGFGRYPHAPLAELSVVDDESLAWYQDALTSSMQDPSKAKFKAGNKRKLDAVEKEIERRASNDSPNEALAAEIEAQIAQESM